MTTLSELCTYLGQDDREKIKEMMEECGPPAIITAAAVYSTKQRQISPYMTRVILQGTIKVMEVCHAVWSADQMVNGDNDLVPKDSIVDLFSALTLYQVEPENENTRMLIQKLNKIIGTCPEPEFEQILSFVSKTNMILIMPDGIVLAILERIKRVLKDDRTFFLILHSAVTMSMLEDVISTVASSQGFGQSIIEELEDQGFRIEAIPEIGGAYMVSAPDDYEEDFGFYDTSLQVSEPDSYPYGYSDSYGSFGYPGSSWPKQSSRRRINRRRQL